MGGTGKTPFVGALTKLLSDRHPAIVSRGYKGRKERTGGKVDLNEKNGAREFGDEPWMLAHQTGVPVYVGKNRVQSVKRAVAEGAEVILFDDGFQNRSVHYRRSILLWDNSTEPASRYVFPLGRLREPLSAARRADRIVSLKGGENLPAKARIMELRHEGPFDHRGEPAAIPGKLGAFCGVGNPTPFFQLFSDRGLLAYEKSFPDHYWYTAADLEALNRAGEAHELSGWVTTEKDWYRLHDIKGQIRLPLYWSRLTVGLGRDFLESLDIFGESK